MEFVSFKKSNGMEQDVLGLKGYAVIGVATYRMVEDKVDSQYLGIGENHEPVYRKTVVIAKGTMVESNSQVFFVRTEQGWVGQKQ